MTTKRLLLTFFSLTLTAMSFAQNVVSNEGAWCWFADPRAIHYANDTKTIDITLLGYIDIRGSIKATQIDWLTGTRTEVLIRAAHESDDHDNPTFLVLPDERIMVFYSYHSKSTMFYRVSKRPGDITCLGPEKQMAFDYKTTYPSPFILSDDPDHIWICWRGGENWHPTIARTSMPDENDDVKIIYGPKQMVQSTGARPYAKYQSNGKDKLYVTYTTSHPDNEMPNWVYFNVIGINGGDPVLLSLTGDTLVWYRKTFCLPAEAEGKKVFIEFEGARQAAEVFLNGQRLGIHENGTMAFGFDLTPYIKYKEDNLIEVRTDNDWNYKEQATGANFQWHTKAFNVNYGGLPKNVWLHVMGERRTPRLCQRHLHTG